MNRRPLTAWAHELLESVLCSGDTAVDATAGNGLDTLFLSRAVGPDGMVYALDVQEQALANTRQRLQAAGALTRTRLLQADHAELLTVLGYELQGRVRAVTFNLGYLPGADKGVVTTPASTVPALRQASTLLMPGGRMTILAYTGHSGGHLEARAVEEWANALGRPFLVREVRPPGTADTAPRLFVVDRESGA